MAGTIIQFILSSAPHKSTFINSKGVMETYCTQGLHGEQQVNYHRCPNIERVCLLSELYLSG